ncbi:ricin-type beta-trefoil lectin domain protein [Streptomyces sp. NPDC002306]
MVQGGGVHTGASDARLTALLRADNASAYPALQELRARHQSSVLAYARLCTTGDSAARQLAAQTYTVAARETARGTDPDIPLRHRLLLLTGRLAASWAADERAAGLDPALLLLLSTAGPNGPVPPMLAAFRSLPSRAQGLIWYGVVDGEPEDRTADFLGLSLPDVQHGTPQALYAMGQACLRSRLAASDDPRCGDFRRLIEESVRPDNPRRSTDLDAHMVRCPHCTAAHEELSALRDAPRTALAEGLLPWSGTAYVRTDANATRVKGLPARRTWSPSRRLVLTSTALGVALAPLLLLLLSSGGSPDRQQAAGAADTPSPPPVTVTATATFSPPPPSPSATSQPPSPSHSPARPKPTSAKPKPTPTPTQPAAPRPPGSAYAQVVNVSTGRCLDVVDDFDNGTDVVTADCTSSATQRWRVDADRGVLQSYADPDFCLDSRGDVDNGVGIWDCDSADGRHGANLTFTVDDDGVIRPAIAIETGVTPAGDGGVSLEPLSGGAQQRWRSGAS